jgi:hypothetical protein
MGDQQAKPIPITTTNAGAPTQSDEHALTGLGLTMTA